MKPAGWNACKQYVLISLPSNPSAFVSTAGVNAKIWATLAGLSTTNGQESAERNWSEIRVSLDPSPGSVRSKGGEGVMRVGREEGNGTVAVGAPLWVVGTSTVVVAASGSVSVVDCETLLLDEAVWKTSVVCVTKDGMEMLAEELDEPVLELAEEVVSEE